MYQILKIVLVGAFVVNIFIAQAEAQEGLPGNIYISGFVLDDSSKGIQGATIIISHENKKLFSLRSTEAGWFESYYSIPEKYLDQEINLTLIKTGFEVARRNLLLKRMDNFIVIYLKPLAKILRRDDSDYLPTGFIYGNAKEIVPRLVNKKTGTILRKPLPGAKISFAKYGKEIAVAYSRESGYFSINYPMKYSNELCDFTATHPRFENSTGIIKLAQQEQILNVDLFPKEGYRFVIKYPLIFNHNPDLPENINKLYENEILIYGKNENYLEITADWGTSQAKAYIDKDAWQLSLPFLTSREHNNLTFKFVNNLATIEQSMQDSILEAFDKVCLNYLGSLEPTSPMKLKQHFNYIIISFIGFHSISLDSRTLVGVTKLQETGEIVQILTDVSDKINNFDEGFNDKILLLKEIRDNIQHVRLEQNVKFSAPEDKVNLALSYYQLIILGKGNMTGVGIGVGFSWFPFKTSREFSLFRYFSTKRFGSRLSSQPFLNLSIDIGLGVHEQHVANEEYAEKYVQSTGRKGHVKFGISLLVRAMVQIQTGIVTTFKDYKTNPSVFFGMGIPILYF